jgi:molybdopterin converting factor subunit 1
MPVTVRFFATLRDRAGVDTAQVDLGAMSTVQAVLDALGERYPGIQPSLKTALVAVNEEFAFPEDPVGDGDTVALFPPVSGGAVDPESQPELFAITTETLDVDAVIAHITRPETGAVCVFTGAVRGLTEMDGSQRSTTHLEYESYESMAENKLRQVAREIRERYPLVQGIAIVQRIGALSVGETTVLVACSSGHRHDGIFEAARYGIDRLKEIVPVWKKEVGPDGSTWVEGHYQPTPADVPDKGRS